jgi:UrcA family protein
LSLVAGSAAAEPAQSSANAGDQSVQVQDLDLSQPKDAAIFRVRVERSAARACNPDGLIDWRARGHDGYQRCVTQTVAETLQNARSLTRTAATVDAGALAREQEGSSPKSNPAGSRRPSRTRITSTPTAS